MNKKLIVLCLGLSFGVYAHSEGADVIVIGSGGAGMTSALTAAENGKKVIVLEKMMIIGGNTNRAAGGLNAANSVLQKANGAEDSAERMSNDAIKAGHYLNNPELTLTLGKNARYAIDYLLSLGANFCHRNAIGAAQTAARGHPVCDGGPAGAEIMRVLSKAAKNNPNIKIITNAKVDKILMKDGKVVGVDAEIGKDKHKQVFDAKAIVLATGGFGANAELVTSLRPEYKGFATTNHPGALGEGLKLATDAGAVLVDTREIQTMPTVVPGKELVSEGVRAAGAYLVNKQGKRFMNELLPRDVVSKGILAQTDGHAFLIFDEKYRSKNKLAQGYVQKGMTVQGNNVQELAKAMGVPENELKKTIDRYTELYKAKKDIDFGRPQIADPMNVFPLYAAWVTPAVHHCMGGVRINKETEVIGMNGKPIPGFYAAGEVTGGVHGGNRIGGNALADIVTFGRIAGKNAANFAN